MKLYDTQSRQLKEIDVTRKQIQMYCCGPTVYRDAHVGNLRTFLLSDLIARVVRLNGSHPYLIQNITDVGHMSEDFINDDKMLAQAKLEKVDPFEIARKYEAKFHQDLADLNIVPAAAYPRASESIDLLLTLIGKLIDADFAYVGSDSSVYFSAQKFASYGAISGNKLDSLKPGHRYEYSEDGAKRFHADWALWKAAGDRMEMVWESPWGKGFPGWHIECCAIALHYLEPDENSETSIDIQGGGSDLIFPHHEMSAAQGQILQGRPFASHYVHAGMIGLDGVKMSKSLGNLVFVSKLVAAGREPMAIRWALMESHFSTDRSWSEELLLEAEAWLVRLRRALSMMETAPTDPVISAVIKAQSNNLDTPAALAAIKRWIELSESGSNGGAPGELSRALDTLLGLSI